MSCEKFDQLAAKVERIYKILGGDTWYTGFSNSPKVEIKAGELLNGLCPKVDKGQAATCNHLPDYVSAIASGIYYKAGLHEFPFEVPETLLGYKDGPKGQKNFAELAAWYIKQFDGIMGQFPLEIEIEDSDPTKKGNQAKTVEIPNVAEALQELFGLGTIGGQNSAVSVNMLMRLAAEMLATRNTALQTYDYARANANFLGYRGNTKAREISYSFNPQKLGTLDELLTESKGYIEGWEENDKESVVAFLQRIAFAAGIIKSVFFRTDKQFDKFKEELTNMTQGGTAETGKEWDAFIAMLNDPNSAYNTASPDQPQPRARPMATDNPGG